MVRSEDTEKLTQLSVPFPNPLHTHPAAKPARVLRPQPASFSLPAGAFQRGGI